MVAYGYLILNGRWLVIVIAIGFPFLTLALTTLVNWPMKIFWKEMDYPAALTTPGLQLMVNPIRLALVSRIPQFVYGSLTYFIGLLAFLLFSSSGHAWERAALMITGYEAGFTVPTVLAAMLAAQDKLQGVFLTAQLLYGRLAFLVLLIVHSIRPLGWRPAAALLAVVMLVLECGAEVAAWRKPLIEITSEVEV
jgi:hypothetical protein